MKLDMRSLAFARMGIALLILWTFMTDWPDRFWFWGDQGLFEFSEMRRYWQTPWVLGPFQFELPTRLFNFFMWIYPLAAVSLFLGFRTRTSCLILWVFTQSMQTRTPLILQGYDQTLRLMLLWGCFLPWNQRYSIDCLMKPDLKQRWIAPQLWVGQIILLYGFAAVAKLLYPAWTGGTALADALQIQHLVTNLGSVVSEAPAWFFKRLHLGQSGSGGCFGCFGAIFAEIMAQPDLLFNDRLSLGDRPDSKCGLLFSLDDASLAQPAYSTRVQSALLHWPT